MRALFGFTNLTIWSFLTALKLDQGLTDQKMTDPLIRRPPPQRGVKWILIDEKLGDLMTAWDKGGYEVLNYVSAVGAAI